MLAPGPADEPMQFVDARDLAAFVLHLADTRTGGTFNVVHPAGTTTIGEVLEAATTASGADTQIEWVDADWLLGQLGDDRHTQLPIWEPEDAGAHRYDSRAAVAAGLETRPVADTVGDTLAWDEERRRDPGATNECGLPADRERELLAAWRSRQA
jgi:nucleoside-diphosphate-sugar epimerase